MAYAHISEGMLDAAIKLGNTATDNMIKNGQLVIEHRKAMRRAVELLKRGRAEEARKALEAELAERRE